MRLFTVVRRSSCSPVVCWILARISSLVTWSLYEMCSVLQLTETCDPKPTCVGFSSAHCVPRVRLRTDDTQGRGTTHTKQRSVRRLQCLWCVLRLFLPCADSCICGLWVGGFFLACEDFGRMFDNSFSACAFFSFFFLIFLKWRLARAH